MSGTKSAIRLRSAADLKSIVPDELGRGTHALSVAIGRSSKSKVSRKSRHSSRGSSRRRGSREEKDETDIAAVAPTGKDIMPIDEFLSTTAILINSRNGDGIGVKLDESAAVWKNVDPDECLERAKQYRDALTEHLKSIQSIEEWIERDTKEHSGNSWVAIVSMSIRTLRERIQKVLDASGSDDLIDEIKKTLDRIDHTEKLRKEAALASCQKDKQMAHMTFDSQAREIMSKVPMDTIRREMKACGDIIGNLQRLLIQMFTYLQKDIERISSVTSDHDRVRVSSEADEAIRMLQTTDMMDESKEEESDIKALQRLHQDVHVIQHAIRKISAVVKPIMTEAHTNISNNKFGSDTEEIAQARLDLANKCRQVDTLSSRYDVGAKEVSEMQNVVTAMQTRLTGLLERAKKTETESIKKAYSSAYNIISTMERKGVDSSEEVDSKINQLLQLLTKAKTEMEEADNHRTKSIERTEDQYEEALKDVHAFAINKEITVLSKTLMNRSREMLEAYNELSDLSLPYVALGSAEINASSLPPSIASGLKNAIQKHDFVHEPSSMVSIGLVNHALASVLASIINT